MYLPGGLDINEFHIDLVCFGHQLSGALVFLVVLARHPELNVLVAELRLQKGPEGREPICGGQKQIRRINGYSNNNRYMVNDFRPGRSFVSCVLSAAWYNRYAPLHNNFGRVIFFLYISIFILAYRIQPCLF